MGNTPTVSRKEQSIEIASLQRRIAELQQRCEEAEDALEAIRYGSVDALVIQNDSGEKVYTLEGSDITYRLLVESINEGAATLVEDGTILYCNRRFAEMLGYPLERIIASPIHHYIAAQSKMEFTSLLHDGITGQCDKGNCRGEVAMTRKDGQTIPVMLSVSNFSVIGSSGISILATDLTERKIADEMRVLIEQKTRAEEELRIAHTDLQIINANLVAEVVEHTKTEAKLQVTQQILQTIVDHLPTAVALIEGRDLRIQMVNPAFYAMTRGRKLEGSTLDEISSQIGQDISSVIRRVLETGEPYQVVDERYQLPGATGKPRETIYISWSAHRLMLPGEQGWGVLVAATETTDRMQMEAILEEARNKYQALIETTSEFIWETDSQGRYTYCSPQMETLWGIKPQEMIGKTPFDQMPPELAKGAIEDFRNLTHSAVPFKGLTSVSLDSKGQMIYIEISGVPFFDNAGNLLGFRGITHDITERKHAEEKLQEAYNQLELRVQERTSELLFLNEELKAEVSERNKAEKKARSNAQFAEGLVQSILVMNSSLDLDQTLDAILEQLRKSVPYSIAAITQLKNDVVHLVRYRSMEDDPEADQAVKLKALMMNYVQQKKIITRKKPFYTEDLSQHREWTRVLGSELNGSYLAIPLAVGDDFFGTVHLTSNQPGAFSSEMISRATAFTAPAAMAIQNALLYKDLQNALQNEQAMRLQLIQVEKLSALSRMLATVVHEINNPVQTVKNCIYLAKLDVPESSNVMETLKMASTEVDRIGNLVSGLRNIYRKPKSITMEPLNVVKLIAEVHLLLEAHLTHNKVTWEQQDPENPLWVSGIADHLKQVFLNISMNAIEAMEPDGGSVTVSIKGDPGKKEVSISITDTGCGINLEDVPKLFEPFYTTKEGGSGLGLPICYEIIQQHGGNILVDSVKGKGTTFTVCLPSIAQPAK